MSLVDGDKVYAGEPDGVYLYQLNLAQRSKLNDFPLVTEIRKDGRGGLWFKNVHDETTGQEPGAERMPVDNLPSHLLAPLSDIKIKVQYQHEGP